MRTIDYQGVTYKLPFSERFRRHTKPERHLLQTSIAENGIKQPVLVYEDTEHGDDCILDGEGRLTAASGMNGVTVPFKKIGRMTTAEAYEQAKIYNDHRRQDDPETIQKRRKERIERVAEARSEGQSLRTIAENEGVSQEQVRKDLKKSGVNRLTPEPEKVTGRDGKKQSRRKKKDKGAASPEPVKQSGDETGDKSTNEQSSTSEQQIQASPENVPVDVVAVVESVCREIDKLNRQLDAIKKEPLAYPVHFHSVQSALRNARETLWMARPVFVDPYCKGTGQRDGRECQACRGTGKVIKSVNTQAERAVGPVGGAA